MVTTKGCGMNPYEAMRSELLKLAFTTSQYSGPLSYGAFPMVSSMPDSGSAGGLQRALTARTAKRMRGEPVEKIAYPKDVERVLMRMTPGEVEAIEKRLPGGDIAYKTPGVFRSGKEILQLRRKTADVSPASSWDGSVNSGGRQASSMPNSEQAGAMQAEMFRRAAQRLEKRSGATTPAGRLAMTRAVGLPRVTAPPGPPISTVSKPKGPGFGVAIPGAKKGTI